MKNQSSIEQLFVYALALLFIVIIISVLVQVQDPQGTTSETAYLNPVGFCLKQQCEGEVEFEEKTYECVFENNLCTAVEILPPPLPVLPECGNGVLEEEEECDDGNSDDFDLCTNSCEYAFCGDGFLQPVVGEECENPNDCPEGELCGSCACITIPETSDCGNGVIEAGEECEYIGDCGEGNYCSSCICSGIPAPSCNENGACEEGETTSSCAVDCFCGNASCDAGETPSDCTLDCEENVCGNNVCEAWESNASCAADCFCGNNSIETADGEVCECGIDGFCGTDDDNTGTETCESVGFDSGTLKCKNNCTGFDASACIMETNFLLPIPGGTFETIVLPATTLPDSTHPTFVVTVGPTNLVEANVRPNEHVRFDPLSQTAQNFGTASSESAGGQAYAFTTYNGLLYWASYARGDMVVFNPSSGWTGVPSTSPSSNPRQLPEIKTKLGDIIGGQFLSLRPTSLFGFSGYLWSSMRTTLSELGEQTNYQIQNGLVIVRQSASSDNDNSFWLVNNFGAEEARGLCMASGSMWGATTNHLFEWDYSTNTVSQSFSLQEIAPLLAGGKFKRIACGSEGFVYGSVGDGQNGFVVFNPITGSAVKEQTIGGSWVFEELHSLFLAPEGVVYGVLEGGTIGYIHPTTFEWMELDSYPGSLYLNSMNGWGFLGNDIYFITFADGSNQLIKYTRNYPA